MGHIRFLQVGFLGSMHDAFSFRLMEPIAPGRNLDLPPNAKPLADKAYPTVTCFHLCFEEDHLA